MMCVEVERLEDRVTVTPLVTVSNGTVEIVGTAGADYLDLYTWQGDLYVLDGDDGSELLVLPVDTVDLVLASLGAGDDTWHFWDSYLDGSVEIDAGAGDDFVDFDETTLTGHLIAILGDGEDYLDIEDAYIHGGIVKDATSEEAEFESPIIRKLVGDGRSHGVSAVAEQGGTVKAVLKKVDLSGASLRISSPTGIDSDTTVNAKGKLVVKVHDVRVGDRVNVIYCLAEGDATRMRIVET